MEPAADREFVSMWHQSPRNDDDADARPAITRSPRKRQAVDRSRQVYSGEERVHLAILPENFHRFLAICGLDYPEGGVGEDAGPP
jgi:hypothetical protein